MIDLHSHLLPGLDDGAPDLLTSLAMARAMVADGTTIAACTPHILPGLYHNSGPQIRKATGALQEALRQNGIPLQLTTGADNHIVPNFVDQLRAGELLTLANSRYVLVEPPHHVAPPRLEEFFFSLLVAEYVPIITHPERLSWIGAHYTTFARMVRAGVWVQVTAGSLSGIFGRTAQYWGERMLDEGCVHLLATDAHDLGRRAPNLAHGFALAAKRVGHVEAEHLVVTRPRGVLLNDVPANLPEPAGAARVEGEAKRQEQPPRPDRRGGAGGLVGRLRRLFEPHPERG